jgi:hypothetical protein
MLRKLHMSIIAASASNLPVMPVIGYQLFVDATIGEGDCTIQKKAMIDTGAQVCVISHDLMLSYILLVKIMKPDMFV